MIDAILKGFGWVVKVCYQIGFQNYLIALILFALVVKIIMLPLGIKQQKNMIKQASLRPKEMAIRKKYAGRNDQPTQQKMQQEIMDLYQRENFNPMGGCLPLLIQLPILMGLYEVIRKPLQYFCGVSKETVTKVLEIIKNNNLLENVKNVEQIQAIDAIKKNFDLFKDVLGEKVTSVTDLPDFDILGINLANTPSLDNFSKEGIILLMVPVLTFVFMFFSMKINKKFTYNANEGTAQDAQAGCSMKMMDYMMPLMSVYITFIVPAVIGIYWIFNNIFSTVQQVILAKVMPLPKFTEEDMKKAEKEMNGKYKPDKKSQNANGEKKKVRSLHRIDEEDYIAPEPEKKKKAEVKGLAGMIDTPDEKKDNK